MKVVEYVPESDAKVAWVENGMQAVLEACSQLTAAIKLLKKQAS